MLSYFLLSLVIQAFAIYMCGLLADLSEGWKKPHIALFVGLIGTLLLLTPQFLMMTEPSRFSPARPTFAGFMVGNVLATIWYVFSFAKFFELGCGGILISLIAMQVITGFSGAGLEKLLK